MEILRRLSHFGFPVSISFREKNSIKEVHLYSIYSHGGHVFQSAKMPNTLFEVDTL
jgi:hypothetical protein